MECIAAGRQAICCPSFGGWAGFLLKMATLSDAAFFVYDKGVTHGLS